ncbi:MAG: FMN-binding protein [Bacteroidales bacterium]|nr:FMN-binding protein [Bacteroidales bacterium]
MKKRNLSIAIVAFLITAAILIACTTVNDGIMSKEKGRYVVNTTKLTADVQGFNGPTPLKIYIKGDKIEKIEALPNEETPGFFARVQEGLLNKWNGMSVKKAATAEVDAVSGATYSSEAVKKNVKAGAEYYLKHK